VAYKYYTHKDATNFTPYAEVPRVFGFPRVITNVTLHHWGDPEQNRYQTAAGIVDWFCGGGAPTSAHEVISAGEVWCIVDHMNAAWANGNAKGNAQSVTLECNPRMSREDFETVAERVADIWIMHDRIIQVTEHRDWFNTACPGRWSKTNVTARAMQYYEAKRGKKTMVTTVAQKIVENKKEGTIVADAISDLRDTWLPGKEGVRHPGINHTALMNASLQAQRIADALTPGQANVKFEGEIHAYMRVTLDEIRKTNSLLQQLLDKITTA
jgi:N-acetylmuramoyl-L-alanine amidase